MVKFFKLLGYFIFFMAALVFFMPKISLYYYAEEELEKHKVVFSKEEVFDKGFSLNIKHIKVSYKSDIIADVANLDLTLYFLHNSLHAQNILLSKSMSSFVPVKVESLILKYSFLHPLSVRAKASGEFGEVSAMLDILDMNASLLLIPSKLMQTKYKKTLRMLKKNDNGSYEYAKNF